MIMWHMFQDHRFVWLCGTCARTIGWYGYVARARTIGWYGYAARARTVGWYGYVAHVPGP